MRRRDVYGAWFAHLYRHLSDMLVNARFRLDAAGFDLYCTSREIVAEIGFPLRRSTTGSDSEPDAAPGLRLRAAARRQGPRRPALHKNRCTDRDQSQHHCGREEASSCNRSYVKFNARGGFEEAPAGSDFRLPQTLAGRSSRTGPDTPRTTTATRRIEAHICAQCHPRQSARRQRTVQNTAERKRKSLDAQALRRRFHAPTHGGKKGIQ